MTLVALATHADAPQAVVGNGTVVIDGDLSDTDWSRATPLALTQQNPEPGGATPFTTTVRLLADSRNLYVAFDCIDPRPKAIAVHTMQHDGDMDGDDSVAVVLDTFGDGRTAYLLRMNTVGARADGLISERLLSLDWDGIWRGAAHRTPGGWTAEIEIPAATLRFQTERPWRFNAERFVARERQTLRWSGISLDASLIDLQRAGTLVGLDVLQQGLGVFARVNAVGRRDNNFVTNRRTISSRPGLDIGYNVTPRLGGVVTINTDFAETEVDTRQINLTRFPLFFPEKRAFFLEGSNQYEFGGTRLPTDFIPFYSRRIGLFDRKLVPLRAGAKILGRSGKWGIAALDAQTATAAGAQATNLFAGRVTYDVDEHLRIGAIATNGSPDGGRDNRFGGVDAQWSTSTFRGDKNLIASAWVAMSGGEKTSGQRTGWGVELNYPNDRWFVDATIYEFGDALEPALGFLPRPGTRKYLLNSHYQPRSRDENSWIRQFFYELFLRRYEDLDGNAESWRILTSPFNIQSHTGVHLEANYIPQFERLEEPFEIADGVFVAPGQYQFDRFRVQGQSSPSRPWRVGSIVLFGGFYDGRLTEIEAFANWTAPSGRLRLELEANNDLGHVAAGSFVQRVLQFKTVLALTPNLVISAYTQYDSESREVGLNNRLRWTIRPEAELFLVWNRGWRHALSEEDRFLAPLSDQFVVKMRWEFRR